MHTVCHQQNSTILCTSDGETRDETGYMQCDDSSFCLLEATPVASLTHDNFISPLLTSLSYFSPCNAMHKSDLRHHAVSVHLSVHQVCGFCRNE